MRQICEISLLKYIRIPLHNLCHRQVLLACRWIRHHSSQSTDLLVASPIEGSENVERYEGLAGSRLDVLSASTGDLGITGRIRRIAQRKPQPSTFFDQLSQFLADNKTSGTTLWYFVKASCPGSPFGNGNSFTSSQTILLFRVLRRVLDEWAVEKLDTALISLPSVVEFYTQRGLMRRIDWVYCLGFLAITAYRKINLHRDESLADALGSRVSDAIHLRTLCKVWKMFLLEKHLTDRRPVTKASTNENLWPELQDRKAQMSDSEYKVDFVGHFISALAKEDSFQDRDVDCYLAYTSILTLAAFYGSMRTFYIDNDYILEGNGHTDPNAEVSHRKGELSIIQPNWHLGREQSRYWTPEIGHLSVDEASIISIIAEAAKDATLNTTLLRITLAQLSISHSDADEVTKIYQGFKSAVPAILTKFRTYVYDKQVYETGALRRHPVRAYMLKAIASNNVAALEHSGAIANVAAPGDALARVKACLQMDDPEKALQYWNAWAQAEDVKSQGWRVWLDYAFKKKDHLAFETAWSQLRKRRIPRTSKMWYQRLFLLHENDDRTVWEHFRTLVRFSGKNEELKGDHLHLIATSTVDIEIFHMMIQGFLAKNSFQAEAFAKAKETLRLLQKQRGVEVTRETFMLFIEDQLSKGEYRSAIQWFRKGHSSQIKFSPKDYTLLFEYSLQANEPSALSDFRADVRQCFDAISEIMRLIHGPLLFARTINPVPLSSSNLDLLLKSRSSVDSVTGDWEDPKEKDIQSICTEIMQNLAQNFEERPLGRAKTARLRLLLLLWDYCVIVGVPTSTGMQLTLRSTINSLHSGLQEKLMSGALFNNYYDQDSLSFHSYRFLRLIGPKWLSQRITSIPTGPTKSRLSKLRWSGYDSLNDKALADIGVDSEEDRWKILDEVLTWKNEASEKRAVAAKRKKEKLNEIVQRGGRSAEQEEMQDEVLQQLVLIDAELASHVQTKQRILMRLTEPLQAARAETQAKRRLVFEKLCSTSSSASRMASSNQDDPRLRKRRPIPSSRPLRPHKRHRRKALLDSANQKGDAGARSETLIYGYG